MAEIAHGFYHLKLPLPALYSSLRYVNVYLIQGTKGYLLVDTGWNTGEAFDSLNKQLDNIGVGIKDISQIVITHIHPDHYGLASRIKQLSQAEISFHYLEENLISLRYHHSGNFFQELARWLHSNGVPPDELPDLPVASAGMSQFLDTVPPDISLRGGEIITTGTFSFQVLWTPGHSPGHICLYEPDKKILLSGDHILHTITTNVSRQPHASDNPLGDYINSLKAIKKLAVDLILPGHENPFSNLRTRITELLQHHKERNNEILATIETAAKTAFQVATEITWYSRSHGANWSSLSPLEKRLAILETLAHLELLRANDKEVNKFSKNDLIYYRQN